MACAITRYNCEDPGQKAEITRLAGKADLQIGSFESIFPWLTRCEFANRHYVAKKEDDTICGWMAINVRNEAGQKFFYLSEISVIRVQDESYRGVGKRLHDALVEDAKKEGMEFIYLYPLNDAVAKTYKEKWGYKSIGELEHLFYKVKNDPSPAVLQIIQPEESPRLYTAKAYGVAMSLKSVDTTLARFVLDKRRALLADKERVADLKNTLEMIEGDDDLSDEDKARFLRDVLEKVTGGRRKKTRRHKKGRQTRRKRNQDF